MAAGDGCRACELSGGPGDSSDGTVTPLGADPSYGPITTTGIRVFLVIPQ